MTSALTTSTAVNSASADRPIHWIARFRRWSTTGLEERLRLRLEIMGPSP